MEASTARKIKRGAKKIMKTFTVGTVGEPVQFKVEEDQFEAIPPQKLPAGALIKYFHLINENQLFDANEFFFQTVLTKDSLEKFNERINSAENPITLGVLGEIAAWLLGEVYMGEASDESKE